MLVPDISRMASTKAIVDIRCGRFCGFLFVVLAARNALVDDDAPTTNPATRDKSTADDKENLMSSLPPFALLS